MNKANNIDEYISSFPKETQERLRQVRDTIRKAAPAAEEAIAYGVPTFKLNGNLVHFAAFKNHLGFYPTPSGTSQFKKELSEYKQGKGSVQFQNNEPLPLKLIEKIVKFRVQQARESLTAKAPKRQS